MTAAKEQLRTLVSNYYHGLVTFQSYREQRDSILDGLKEKAPIAAERASGAARKKPVEETRTRAVEPAPQQPPPAPAADPAPRPWTVGRAVATAVVVAIVVAGWLAVGRSPETPSPVAAEDKGSPALPPGATLLEQFLQRNAWDRDAARNLEVTWGTALTEEQRQAALSSATYTRFSETLRGRLREEEALSGPEGSEELETLAALADRFGVPHSARRVARSNTAAPAPPPPVVQAADQDTPASAPSDEAAIEESGEELVAAVPTPSEPAPVVPSEPAAPDPVAAGATEAGQVAETPASSTAVPSPPPATSAEAATGATPVGSACSAALLNTRRPVCSDALRSGGTGPVLAILPPGEFEMGGDQTNDERPAHAVTIGRALAVSVYEVSFGDFAAYCRAAGQRCPENPWGSDDFPAVVVSWDEAVAYAAWLSAETGQTYRLPSEAEWEYAARAGSTARYPFGDEVTPVAARSSANGPVDSPLANSDRSVNRNGFRLFHMIGNVREWVADHWVSGYVGAPADGSPRSGGEGNRRVVRGGSYSDGPLQLRSAARLALDGDARDRFTGFRLVRELPP